VGEKKGENSPLCAVTEGGRENSQEKKGEKKKGGTPPLPTKEKRGKDWSGALAEKKRYK